MVSTTAIGRAAKDRVVTSSGAKPGDYIILTKWAGLEGTAIIAHDFEKRLRGRMDDTLLESAQAMMGHISVVKEGLIAGEMGATAMHDVTEGGVLGALWELAEASGVGLRIYQDKIPVRTETGPYARNFGLNPLKLISSGCMLITCRAVKGCWRPLTGKAFPLR